MDYKLGYLLADFICSEKRTVLRELSLEEYCELWRADNVQGQISEHISAPNGGYCVYLSNVFLATCSFENWVMRRIQSRDAFRPIGCERNYVIDYILNVFLSSGWYRNVYRHISVRLVREWPADREREHFVTKQQSHSVLCHVRGKLNYWYTS